MSIKNIFVFSWDSNAVSIVFFSRLVKLQKEQSGGSIMVFYSCPNVRDCVVVVMVLLQERARKVHIYIYEINRGVRTVES
jgi:hypothetical protein